MGYNHYIIEMTVFSSYLYPLVVMKQPVTDVIERIASDAAISKICIDCFGSAIDAESRNDIGFYYMGSITKSD